nr:MAG: hypothetical protein [Chemarfal virus 268]
MDEQRWHLTKRKHAGKAKRIGKKAKRLYNRIHRDYGEEVDKVLSNIPDDEVRGWLKNASENDISAINYRTPQSQPIKDGRTIPGSALQSHTPTNQTSSQRRGPTMRTSYSKRPLRSRRKGRYGKPPSRRTRRFSRMRTRGKGKGLKNLIKKIAMDAAEPRRHVTTILQPLTEDGFSVFPLARVPLMNTIPTTAQFPYYLSRFQGNRFFLKGVRVKGQVFNKSQYPALVDMFYMTQKQKHLPTVDLVEPLQLAQTKIWYNPETGTEDTLVNLTEAFSRSPKMHWSSPFKVLKRKKVLLSTTGYDQPAVQTEAGRSDQAGVQDTWHFDMYFPINKVIHKNTDTSVDGIVKFLNEYYIGFLANPYDYTQTFDTNSLPTLSMKTIAYFKEI